MNEKEQKNFKKKKKSLQENIKHSDVSNTGVPKGSGAERKHRKLFEDTMDKEKSKFDEN